MQADQDSLGQHPLELELQHRLDVLARYQQLISEAQADGREDVVAAFLAQQARQEEYCRVLRSALERTLGRG